MGEIVRSISLLYNSIEAKNDGFHNTRRAGVLSDTKESFIKCEVLVGQILKQSTKKMFQKKW